MRPEIWRQLKNISCDELIRALLRDGWILYRSSGALRTYRHSDGRKITIHYHPGKNYGPSLLKSLLEDIGWSEYDFKRLKLVK